MYMYKLCFHTLLPFVRFHYCDFYVSIGQKIEYRLFPQLEYGWHELFLDWYNVKPNKNHHNKKVINVSNACDCTAPSIYPAISCIMLHWLCNIELSLLLVYCKVIWECVSWQQCVIWVCKLTTMCYLRVCKMTTMCYLRV